MYILGRPEQRLYYVGRYISQLVDDQCLLIFNWPTVKTATATMRVCTRAKRLCTLPISRLFFNSTAREKTGACVSKLKQKRNLRLKSISLIAYKRRNRKVSANHHRAWEVQSYRELKYLNSWILPCLHAYYGIPVKEAFVSHPYNNIYGAVWCNV